jgi:hypothetical protein
VDAGKRLCYSACSDNDVAGCHINYLIEGLDLVGTLLESGNTSGAPRLSDTYGGFTDHWGALDRVAHHPSRAGWVDVRVHCER